ncbi:hypothetical protein OM416_19855 [Paenibacillus sp. LS1]|uniref:hypothetical protein n=1 Tax=Paenibacillus sp. LS1 TaxID=2992120 RepID=UPI00222E85DD|nr:hypothetical protein [Paenibacillus sp. LS1]MCW3793851.1 hypothetical protein [Paenibacillus sp. LS1]
MGIKNLFRQIVQINKEIREEKFHEDQNKAFQFIQSLTHVEKEELLAALLIAGVEHDGGTIDEYLEELEERVSIKRKTRKSEEIQMVDNTPITKNYYH